MSRKKTTIDQDFSNRLKFLMESEWKVKPAQLAKTLNVTGSYVSMVAKGKRGPSADMMKGLYLNYSPYMNWLLTGEMPMKVDEPQKAVAVAGTPAKNYADILRMTAEIMESGSIYADALKSNVVAFHRAVTREALPAMETAMELRIKQIVENELRLIRGTGDPPGEWPDGTSRKDKAVSDEPPEGPELGKMGM